MPISSAVHGDVISAGLSVWCITCQPADTAGDGMARDRLLAGEPAPDWDASSASLEAGLFLLAHDEYFAVSALIASSAPLVRGHAAAIIDGCVFARKDGAHLGWQTVAMTEIAKRGIVLAQIRLPRLAGAVLVE